MLAFVHVLVLLLFYLVFILMMISQPAFAAGNITSHVKTSPSSRPMSIATTKTENSYTSGLGSSIKATSTFTTVSPSTSTLPPTTGPRAESSGSSKISLIIIGVAVVVVVGVILLLLLLTRRRMKARRNSLRDSRPVRKCGSFDASSGRRTIKAEEHAIGLPVDMNIVHSDRESCARVSPPKPRPPSRSPQRPRSSPNLEYECSYDNHGIHEENYDDVTVKPIMKGASMLPGRVKQLISAAHGGILETEDVTLQVWPGCLSKDTEITIIKDEHYVDFKHLLDMGIINHIPLVLEFLPDRLAFLTSGADMTVRLPHNDPDLEVFVLHGSYDRKKERIIWQVVNDELEVKRNEGMVYMRINGFCFYSYIMSKRGKLARILSHLNDSFNCYAVGLFRRIPTIPGFHLAVVLMSEFIQRNPEGNDELSQMTSETNPTRYYIGARGTVKHIDTHRPLQVCLQFPVTNEDEITLSERFDKRQLDAGGMVLDTFPETINQQFPASGKICIYEYHRNERRLIWTLYITESVPTIEREVIQDLTRNPNTEEPNTVMRRGSLTSSLISRLSRKVGVDWDSLAGLMNIPYGDREQIRFDNAHYPDISSKANKISKIFHESQDYNRHHFVQCLRELGLNDVVQELLQDQLPTVINQDEDEEDEVVSDEEDIIVVRRTPLSSREMSRISRICVDWESLAGLMDISSSIRDDIRTNVSIYPDAKSKTEKILDIFNKSSHFCRDKLTGFFEEMQELRLVEDFRLGSLRSL